MAPILTDIAKAALSAAVVAAAAAVAEALASKN